MVDILEAEHGTASASNVYIAVSATVFFNESETSCMVGINELGVETTFSSNGETFVGGGFGVEWPDDETGRKVMDLYRITPHMVLLVEYGPHGVIVDHTIVD